jgi:tetratricopeptide (TPR) repeat protein
VLNNLAMLYLGKKRYTEAESLSKKALEINRKKPTPDYPNLNVVNRLRNLGEIYEKTGRPDKAENYYRESEETREKIAF